MQPGVCGAKRSTPSLAGASLLLARSPLILSLLILCLGCGSTPSLDSAPSQQASTDLDAARTGGLADELDHDRGILRLYLDDGHRHRRRLGEGCRFFFTATEQRGS